MVTHPLLSTLWPPGSDTLQWARNQRGATHPVIWLRKSCEETKGQNDRESFQGRSTGGILSGQGFLYFLSNTWRFNGAIIRITYLRHCVFVWATGRGQWRSWYQKSYEQRSLRGRGFCFCTQKMEVGNTPIFLYIPNLGMNLTHYFLHFGENYLYC